MLIEDNVDHQLLERKALEELGAGTQVVTVATAIEGLETLERQDFDLVVADYQMPGMNGLEFLRTLNEHHITVPVVIVTGLGNERVAVAALKQGAYDYIIKETGYLELLPSIAERAIATFRTKRQLDEARRQLAESEERYRELVHGLDAIVWEVDPVTWQFTFVSQRAEAILGYPLEQWLTEPNFWVSLIHPEDREQAVRFCQTATAEKRDHEFEYRALAADERVVWLRDIVRVVCENGEVTGLRGLMVNITERKQAEEELQRQKRYLESLMQYSPLAIAILDMNHHLVSCNPAFEHLFQYHETEAIGKNLDDLVAPGETVAEAKALTQVVLAGGTIQQVTRRRRRDGTVLDVEVFGVPVVVEEKQIGVFALYHDITERQRAEAERQVISEIIQGVNVTANLDELLHLIHQSLKKVIYAENCFVALYDRSTGMFDFPFFVDQYDTAPPPQKAGKSCTAYVFHTGRPLLITEEPFRQLVEQGEVELVGTSSPVWLGVPLKTPSETIGVLVVQHYEDEHAYTERDLELLTSVGGQIALAIERKRAETALREAEARYRDLYENANDIIYTHDLQGRFTSVNRAGLRTFGYTLEEALQRDITAIVDPAYLPLAQHRLQEKMVAGGITGSYELLCHNKDGRPIWLEVNSRLIEKGGQPVGIQGIARDITERKQAEEENRRLQQQLLQAQKMESIGTLAGGIAHDFNNLLQGILGYASLALQDVDQHSTLHRYLRTILESAERAAHLINQMLTFSRRKEPQVEPIDVNHLIEDSLRMLRHMIPTTIEIKTRLAPNLWTVEADAIQIQQVLINLCVNARDAMPGGGTLVIETENRVISEVEAERRVSVAAGPYIVITVFDTGVGMTAAVRERIFEPFFTTKGIGEGTGLGLAVVYGIVRSHKGWINVYSEPGQGSVFKIYLAATEKEAFTEESTTEAISGGSETILVVDDEPVVLQLACDILRSYGYHTLTAGDGEEALRVYLERVKDIDLVLLDLTMPKLSGIECARKLKALNPTIRLAASSGYSAQARAMLDGEIQAFVSKPYSPEELARVVRTVLDASDSSIRVDQEYSLIF